MTNLTCQVAIIGAGPYGLAAAAHLRGANVDLRVFGKAMEFWERQMPAGMLLRSYWDGSHISDPRGELSLNQYQGAMGTDLPRPVRLEHFVDYGQWFQRKVVPDLDDRRVLRVEAASKCFRLVLEDDESIWAQRVIIATGIGSFAWCPPQFKAVSPSFASHSSEHRDLNRFAGQQVVVVGGGQSALESAALLNESGASVELIVRAPRVRWLRYGTPLHSWLHKDGNPLRRILYPPSDVGPPGVNWIVDTPDLLRRLPFAIHSRIARRAIRPAGAGWLRPRLSDVKITTGRVILSANPDGRKLRLRLNDDTERLVDHILLATGYRVDISRCAFLAPELARSLQQVDGYPKLIAGFEASLPGLHFIGASAARSFGPLMRFVAGTKYAASELTRCILGQASNLATHKVACYEWNGIAQTHPEG